MTKSLTSEAVAKFGSCEVRSFVLCGVCMVTKLVVSVMAVGGLASVVKKGLF